MLSFACPSSSTVRQSTCRVKLSNGLRISIPCRRLASVQHLSAPPEDGHCGNFNFDPSDDTKA